MLLPDLKHSANERNTIILFRLSFLFVLLSTCVLSTFSLPLIVAALPQSLLPSAFPLFVLFSSFWSSLFCSSLPAAPPPSQSCLIVFLYDEQALLHSDRRKRVFTSPFFSLSFHSSHPRQTHSMTSINSSVEFFFSYRRSSSPLVPLSPSSPRLLRYGLPLFVSLVTSLRTAKRVAMILLLTTKKKRQATCSEGCPNERKCPSSSSPFFSQAFSFPFTSPHTARGGSPLSLPPPCCCSAFVPSKSTGCLLWRLSRIL